MLQFKKKAILNEAEQVAHGSGKKAAPTYTRIVGGCVNGYNIVKYADKSIDECAEICDQLDTCVAFEYGVAYGGDGVYTPRDCQPQSASDTAGCDGYYHNLDIYIKEADFVLTDNKYVCDSGYKVIKSKHLCQVAGEYFGLGRDVVIEHTDAGDPMGCWGYSDETGEEITHLYFNFEGTETGARSQRNIICAKPQFKQHQPLMKKKVTPTATQELPQCTGYFFWPYVACHGCDGTPIPNRTDGAVYYHYYYANCGYWAYGTGSWEEEDYSWLYDDLCGETCPGNFCAEKVCPQCGKCVVA